MFRKLPDHTQRAVNLPLYDIPVKSETCYACDELADGIEHVPPKIFVPLAKRNRAFFQVPACRRHNQDRSADDQYTAVTMAIVTPSAYQDQGYLEKLQRTLARRSGALGERLRRSTRREGGQLIIEHDTTRTSRVFGDVARALYFIETGCKAAGDSHVSAQGAYLGPPGFSKTTRVAHPEFLGPLRYAFHETDAFPVRGRDHSVLWYQVAEQGAVRFWLNESIEVIVWWPWCDVPGLFGRAADWLSSHGRDSDLARTFRTFRMTGEERGGSE